MVSHNGNIRRFCEENRETFSPPPANQSEGGAGSKSLLLLFFRKEDSCFLAAIRVCAVARI
jgi:hypothetical protein